MAMNPALLIINEGGIEFNVHPMFGGVFAGVAALVAVVVGLICLAGMWKVFVKAGQPGWAVLIPFYNVYVLLKIAGKPGWWLILAFIPFVNIVIAIVVSIAVAKCFGQGAAFGVFLLFLFGIGYPILGFGNYTYVAPPAPAA
jgi:hypothetical protein